MVESVCVVLTLFDFELISLKKGLSHHVKGRPYTQRVVTDFKNVLENDKFYFHSTSMFVKYLGLIIILELN